MRIIGDAQSHEKRISCLRLKAKDFKIKLASTEQSMELSMSLLRNYLKRRT